MTEDVESALLGHVVNLAGAVEHVRGIAEQTLEQAKRTNGRVSDLEEQVADHAAWRTQHDHKVELHEAHAAGATAAHAEHAERSRQRRAAWARVFRFAFDNWELGVAIGVGVAGGLIARWIT